MSAAMDRVKMSLRAMVSAWMVRTDFHALYACTVKGQNGDGTLALVPDAPRLPPMDFVPLRLGLPGVSVKVAPGSRVLLGFENGNPGRPVATLWELSNVLELSITTATQVTVNAPSVNLGGSTPVDSVVLGTKLAAFFAAHVHTSNSPGNPTSPPLVPMTPLLVASSIVKAN